VRNHLSFNVVLNAMAQLDELAEEAGVVIGNEEKTGIVIVPHPFGDRGKPNIADISQHELDGIRQFGEFDAHMRNRTSVGADTLMGPPDGSRSMAADENARNGGHLIGRKSVGKGPANIRANTYIKPFS